MFKFNPVIHLFFVFLTFNIYSQSNLIIGTIKNSNNESIILSSIVLKDEQKIITFSHTKENGYYELKTTKTGKFTLTFSALNYQTQTIDIEITNETKIIKKNITLVYKPLELKEVIITSERPIIIKKDTVIFNVKSFLQGNEHVVEDLLKKIPGLNVLPDGTIKVGNQEVEKIMIEGDDFFEKGYKIVTKNMPVQPIEKVELYQHYSTNKHLKGIENSDKVALNLKLKDDFKRKWFGNLELGYGLVSENRYEVSSNLMNFGKKNKYYIIANLNNCGNNAIGEINNLIRPYRFDDLDVIGDDQSVNSIIDLSTYTPNLKDKRVNFNNAELFSLNSIFTLSPKTKLKTVGFLNSDENDFLRNSFQTFSIGTTNFQNIENFIGRKSKITTFGKIELTYDISKNKTLECTTKFNITDENNKTDLKFNENLITEKLKNNNQLFDEKIVFTNKIQNNKILILSGRFISEKTPQDYKINQFLYQDLFSLTANNIIQTSENKMQFVGFDSHLLDKNKNGNLFEIQLGNQFRKDILISKFEIKNDEIIIDQPLNYQNNLSYTSNDLYIKTKYLQKFKKWSLISNLDFHQLINDFEKDEKTQIQNTFFINPKLNLEWHINKKSKILTSYSVNKSNVTILDVYNNYIQTGFRTFSRGINDFNQMNKTISSLNYTYGNWGDKFFLNTYIMYLKNNDFFSTNSIVAQNYSQSEKIIIKDRESLTFSSSIDKYFKSISSNLKITFNSSQFDNKNIINNSEIREVNNSSLNYGIEMRSGFRGFFNYHIGTKWDNNKIKTTITNSYTNNMSFFDLSFAINDNINFQIQTERYYFGSLDKQNNQYYFSDFEARYKTKKDNLIFSLIGNNLFNTQTFRNYNITDISISKTEYRLQPRYLLLKMELRF